MKGAFALYALLMALWRRSPQGRVTIHSCRTPVSKENVFRQHGREPNMDRSENRHDNAVAEEFSFC